MAEKSAPVPIEFAALRTAGDAAVDHIENVLKRTDIATWSVEEFDKFIETVCAGYALGLIQFRCEAIKKAATPIFSDDEVPF